ARLVAYLVPAGAEEPAPEALRRHLRESLPEYMVPAAFVVLGELPLLPNGKVNRRALPEPEPARPEPEAAAAPRDPTEELVAGIWEEVLGRDKLGVHDNFFELGGHSLLATLVFSRIRDAFAVEVPLRRLFEAPTVADLAAVVQSIRRQGQGPAAPPLVPVARDQELPPSFAQQRLWFLDQFEPGSPVYNIPTGVRMRGAVTAAQLEWILNQVVRRHEALRTTFTTVAGRPLQVITRRLHLSLPVVDLSRMPGGTREAELQRLSLEQGERPFDLTLGPLVRFVVVQLGEEDHVVLMNMHHIVSDAWSLGILCRELTALYADCSQGRPASLPELPVQYADFAHWQRQWLSGEVLEAETAYWRTQLAGAPPHCELPTDRPRPEVQTFSGSWRIVELSRELSRDLAALGRQQNATLFMTLLAAFTTLLFRHTGQHDVVVGSPIAGRNRREIEALIGFFVNTLVLRSDLSGGPSYRELLARVAKVALDAYAHQDLPFEKLVDELQPERDPSAQPLFQVMFMLQNAPVEAFEAPGLRLSSLPAVPTTVKFDLTVTVDEGDDGLVVAFGHNTDLFDRATIGRLAGHFQNLLAGVVADPQVRLSELPLLSPAESHQLVAEWNDVRSDYPDTRLIHEHFERWAERTPEAPAVVYEGQYLSYRELDRRANRLAHHLRALGVGPEVVTGIYLERSVDTVVGILAILKAGGAYLPLDLSSPPRRLAMMLEDAGAPVLVTVAELAAAVSAHLPESGLEVVCLDRDAAAIARRRDDSPRPVPWLTADPLAYVIYTSGSTGRPKGVAIVHRAIGRLIFNTNYIAPQPGDRIAQASTTSFDAATFELWGALARGAQLRGIAKQVALDPRVLAAALRDQGITVLFLTTALFNQMARQDPAALAGVRHLLFGGEAADPPSVREVLKAGAGRLLHVYGPTESTTFTTWQRVREVPDRARTIPIGGPLANTEIYVLDRFLSPVPVGVAGELAIGGDGLARGYVKRPRGTAEKLIPDPLSERAGERLYRTGDLVRYLPEGRIEFLGRIDHQVKVRGFRIELGEIEAVLSRHPTVRESVVLASAEISEGGRRLVAYVVRDADDPESATPEVPELRRFLGGKLPDYMVPAVFVFLDALPLTPGGKVDRRALPAPGHSRPELEEAFVAPRTPAEETLARIWSQVLAVERVGVHDNFFDLGGDSILGIQVVSRAQEAGLRLAPRDLFRFQTVAELAAVAGAPAPETVQGIVTGAVSLTPIQHWFFARDLPEPHHFNQAVMLEVAEPPDPLLLERALAALEEHHDALRLRFLREPAGWRQFNAAPGGAPPFVRVDLSALPEAPQRAAVTEAATELQGSLDLARGPLWRVALLDLGPGKAGRLLWVIHHLAVDGVSWRVLLKDLERTVRQAERGETIALAPKTESFQGWARRLQEHARSQAVKEEEAWWLAEPGSRVSPLPADFAGGVNTVASARTVSVALEADETRSLLREVPAAYHTRINEVLLTALLQAFTRWTGTTTLLVDLEGHGREELFPGVDLSRTVGWFTAIYPVLLERRTTSDPGADLIAVKEHLRVIPNGGIGYGLLRYLGDAETAERLRGRPHAEVSFNYLGQLDPVFSESALWRLAQESSGAVTGPGGIRSHLLEINGGVVEGRLSLTWTYSESVHRRATVERVAEGFIEALRALIRHCLAPGAGAYTPADFPKAKLAQKDLDKVLAQIRRKRRT
ncbi:MAG: amino acid adenylation domain-containing protein, partial [bacterium]|nr:amino acid adenylation domain-containing protein [bacterium]